MKFKINPDIFFLFNNKDFILWNYSNHKQYKLEKKYFDVLLEISETGISNEIEIVRDLEKTNIIGDFENPVWGWDVLSRIFHVGTSDLPNNFQNTSEGFAKEYVEVSNEKTKEMDFSSYEPEGDKILLPQANYDLLKDKNFLQILLDRKTSRSFSGQEISLEFLSTVLYLTFADIKRDDSNFKEFGLQTLGLRKTSPSGGGMHPSECYLFAFNVIGIEAGVYHYSSEKHRLTLINKKQFCHELPNVFRGQYFASELSAGICITSRFDKLWEKYAHSRAYRVALMDVGHLSQTFQLVATSLGFLTWPTAMIQDTEMSEILCLNQTEKPITFIGIGSGMANPIPKNFI